MINDNEFLDPKYKLVAINMDDDDETGGGAPEKAEDDDEPTLTLGMEPMTETGERLSFANEFTHDTIDDYLLLQPDDEEHFRQALPWLNILSLAGARTFSREEDLILFVDPDGSWIDLYFDGLPGSLSDASYAELFWSVYSSIDLWLKDNSTGEIIKTLRLVAPEKDDAYPGS